LAEGVRMVSRVLDLDPEQLRVGLPVGVVFDDVTPEVTLPKFRPLPPSAAVQAIETGHESLGPTNTCV